MDKNNKNIIIVLAGGFFVAVLVALMVQAALNSKPSSPSDDLVKVLVATKPLKTGHKIIDGDFTWRGWPEESVFDGSIVKQDDTPISELVGGRLLRSLSKDQPVHEKVISKNRSGNFLAIKIEDGKRAVGLPVRAHALADRLIKPGDYVDVILTHKLQINARENPDADKLVKRYATETVVQNIRVLAVDNIETPGIDEEEEGKSNKKTSNSATVTLEASPKEAEYLNLATKLGDIGLALRSIGDEVILEDDIVTTDVDMSSVLGELARMRQTTAGVRVYNGDSMSEIEARNVGRAYVVSAEDDYEEQYNETDTEDSTGAGDQEDE